MMNVLVYDNRLEGSVPKFDGKVIEAGKHMSLPELVNRLQVIADESKKIGAIHVMAHGIEEEGVGGYGVLLCKEELTNNTVHMLRPLRGKVDKIVLLVCGAAQKAQNNTRLDGDGELFCHRLASLTRTWVKASTVRQHYVIWSWEKSWGTDFGNWEGDAWWFSPDGRKLKADMTTY
ncbi:MAG TPA: hypothetical protein VFP64_02220 [Pyrinomonadaceae bacterium]|nr:hypothetical protein [Pyrinomonadaceae bacterium]